MANTGPHLIQPLQFGWRPEPFSHDDFLFEIKHDGFHRLGHIEHERCKLTSINGNEFSRCVHTRNPSSGASPGRGPTLLARGDGLATVELNVPVKPETIMQSGW